MKFFIKDFFSKCDQIRRKLLRTFSSYDNDNIMIMKMIIFTYIYDMIQQDHIGWLSFGRVARRT